MQKYTEKCSGYMGQAADLKGKSKKLYNIEIYGAKAKYKARG
jgi:hypothetical protein